MSSEGVGEMSEDNEKSALVPRLRFPEFRDAGEWEAKPLAAIARITQGGTPSTSVSEYWGGSIQWLTPAEMGKEVSPYISKTARAITEKGLRNCSSELLPLDSVILSTRAPIGHLAINTVPMAINQGCRGIVVQTDSNAQFVYYSLGHCRTSLENLGAGNTFKELSGSALKSFVFPVPPKNEQKKIADFLSSLDELIAAETQKLDALKTHKKGLMQQLFPRKGETVPRLRFPEFRGMGEWKKRKISDLLARSIRPVDVDADATYREIGIRSHGKGLFHKELVSGKALGDKRVFWVEEDAFVVNIVFAWEQAVAVTSVAEKGMIASHRFPMYLARKSKSDVDFIRYFFLTKKGKELLGIASPGGAGRNKTLGQKDFENLEFLSPEHVEEQAEIARCLSSLDNLITTQGQEIDALKMQKKGLMQQLFPVLDEVSA
jgi:type I restriction enzyme S subunit